MVKTAAKKKPAPRERLVEIEVAKPQPESVKKTKSRVKQCAFCKHFYINPCDDKTKEKCPNYLFLQSRGKKVGKTK